MFRQHQRGLTEQASAAIELDPAVGRHRAALASWRQRSPEEQWLAIGGDDVPFAPGIEPARGRIRVGLFCPCLGLGGAEAWQLALASAVDPAAVVWRGAVVTEGKRSVTPTMLGQLSQRMPVGYGLAAARTLASAVDVVVSWSVLDHDALCRGLDRAPKVILACHFPGEMPWTDAAEQLLARVDRLVAVSELAVDSLPGRLRSRADVIWNAVDPARLVPMRSPQQTRAGWGLPEGSKVAGYLGRLAPEKDPDALLRLAEHLPDPWSLVLVGDGREEPALRAKIDLFGLDRVRLIPGTDAVGTALAAFDALIVPSRYESFGLTMAEGFWAGVPVISTHVGLAKLVPGLVREIGFVPSGAELAHAVIADATEVESTQQRVKAAQTFARDRLDLALFGRNWTALIRDVAEASSPNRHREVSCFPIV